MTIIHARVDERLIHGQVATVWTRITGTERIVVVNDEAIKDEMLIGVLKMAKPAGIKLSIVSVNKGIQNFVNDKYEEKVFVLTKNIQDMKKLIDGGAPIKEFNVGNISKHEGATQIKNSVSLTSHDVEDIKELDKNGVVIKAQMVPGDKDEKIMTFIEKANL